MAPDRIVSIGQTAIVSNHTINLFQINLHSRWSFILAQLSHNLPDINHPSHHLQLLYNIKAIIVKNKWRFDGVANNTTIPDSSLIRKRPRGGGREEVEDRLKICFSSVWNKKRYPIVYLWQWVNVGCRFNGQKTRQVLYCVQKTVGCTKNGIYGYCNVGREKDVLEYLQ